MPDRISRVITPQFLQGVALGFTNRALAADRLSPILQVNKDRGLYRVFGKNELLQHEARWSYGAIPNAIDYRWSSDTYFSEPRKLRIKLLDAEVRNADSDLDLRRSYTRVVTNSILIAREKRVSDLFTTAGNYPGPNVVTKGGGAEWDTVAVGTPTIIRTDLDAAIRQVTIGGIVPRSEVTIAIPEPVYDQVVRFNPTFLASITPTSQDSVGPEMLARYFGIKEVIILAVMTTGAGPEVANSDVVTGFTATYLWGDNVWVGVVAGPNADDMTPSFSRTFNWRADTGGQLRQIRQYRFDDEGAEADWIECKENMGEKIVFSGAGYLIKNTLSTI